jgi:CubicO group peptidase (beta-lactamase class C family)
MTAPLVFSLLIAPAAPPPSADGPRLEPAKVERIVKRMRAYMAAQGVPGLSIAVVMDGQFVWSGGYGLADVENDVPARATTAYRSASIGKTMTATAAMQLAEQGKLDLDADIRRYCPAFPAKPYTISARHLLAHLSGIRHYGGPHDAEEQSSTVHYANVADALAPFKDDPLLFTPGTKFSYSTYGYDVLGCVIEGAAGVPFLTYMRAHVWDPAGMTATRDDDPSAIIRGRAPGYTREGGALRKATMVDMSNRLPAGGYVTTVEDLARFAAAVMAGRLVRPETFRQMTTPTLLPDGTRAPYGLGWGLELEEWHQDVWTFHGGSTPGASGMLALMPRHRFAVAVLTNLEELPERSELLADVARIVLGFPMPANQAASMLRSWTMTKPSANRCGRSWTGKTRTRASTAR